MARLVLETGGQPRPGGVERRKHTEYRTGDSGGRRDERDHIGIERQWEVANFPRQERPDEPKRPLRHQETGRGITASIADKYTYDISRELVQAGDIWLFEAAPRGPSRR